MYFTHVHIYMRVYITLRYACISHMYMQVYLCICTSHMCVYIYAYVYHTVISTCITHTKHNTYRSHRSGLAQTACTATHCNILQHTATHYNILQHTATHYNILQHTATHYNILQHYITLQRTGSYCNAQHVPALHDMHYAGKCRQALHPNLFGTATHRSIRQHFITLQRTGATHCMSQSFWDAELASPNTLQHAATHCNTLHHTAPHGNTPHHTAPYCNTILRHIALQRTPTRCNTLPTQSGRQSLPLSITIVEKCHFVHHCDIFVQQLYIVNLFVILYIYILGTHAQFGGQSFARTILVSEQASQGVSE